MCSEQALSKDVASPPARQTPTLLPVLPGDPERGGRVRQALLCSASPEWAAVVSRYQNEPTT